jgi:hypothetical protein
MATHSSLLRREIGWRGRRPRDERWSARFGRRGHTRHRSEQLAVRFPSQNQLIARARLVIGCNHEEEGKCTARNLPDFRGRSRFEIVEFSSAHIAAQLCKDVAALVTRNVREYSRASPAIPHQDRAGLRKVGFSSNSMSAKADRDRESTRLADPPENCIVHHCRTRRSDPF